MSPAIYSWLGTGGMGEVRLCRDHSIGRDVAMKTLLDRDERPPSQRRFLREVRIQGQLEHPAIVPVYDMGVGAEGELFFTMRRVRGQTLADVLAALASGEAAATAAYSRRKLLSAFVNVCLAVDYAHSRGVLHRDLKPANIMLGDFGEVYVLDWGIARVLAEPTAGVPARDAAAPVSGAGTPGYMAPEQIRGDGRLQDARTDVHALGAVLYELLTFQPLYSGSIADRCRDTLAGGDARASRVVPDVPPELDEACVRATLTDPSDRYASARELALTVERYLDGDRDVARRRELAEEHVAGARAAMEHAKQTDATGAEAARADAMRRVVQALALDVEQPEARHLLVKLLLEVPEKLPPTVEAEMARASVKARLQTARFGLYALVSWAVTIPFVALLGVRDATSFGLASLLCVASAALAMSIWRRQTVTPNQFIALALLVSATCGALSCWLGPFILVPTAAATSTIWFTFQADRRERWLIGLLGGLGIFVPFLLEIIGVIPPSFSFSGDNLILHARALHLPPLGTTLALEYSSVAFCVLQPLLLGGIRDALTAAERKLFLQSWHLRQLAPGAAPQEGPPHPGLAA